MMHRMVGVGGLVSALLAQAVIIGAWLPAYSEAGSVAITATTSRNETREVPSYSFEFADKESFGVAGPLYLPTIEEQGLCELKADVQGMVVVGFQSDGCAIIRWVDQTKNKGGIGVIYYVNVNLHQAGQFAWIYWERSVPFSSIPVVTAELGDDAEWMISRGADDPVIVSLKHTQADNPFEVFVDSSLHKLTSTLIMLHCGYNVFQAGFKSYALFYVAHEFHVTPMVVLVSELMSNTIRLVWFTNSALAREQGVAYSIYRFTASSHMAWSFASTVAVCLELWKIYKEKRGFERPVMLFSGVMTFCLLGDVIISVYSSTMKEIPFHSFLSALYGLIQLPLGWAFHIFGGRVSKTLLEGAKMLKSSSDEVKRRKTFARQIRLSGLAMVANVLCLLAFPLLISISVPAFQYGYAAMVETAVLVSTLQIGAMRVPDSVLRKMGYTVASSTRSSRRTSNRSSQGGDSANEAGGSNTAGIVPRKQSHRPGIMQQAALAMSKALVEASDLLAKEGEDGQTVAVFCLSAAAAHNHVPAKLALAELLFEIDTQRDVALQHLQSVVAAYDEAEELRGERSLDCLEAVRMIVAEQKKQRRLGAFMQAIDRGLAIAIENDHKEWLIALCLDCVNELMRFSDFVSALQYVRKLISQCKTKGWHDHAVFFRLLNAQLCLSAVEPNAIDALEKAKSAVEVLEKPAPMLFSIWLSILRLNQAFADGDFAAFKQSLECLEATSPENDYTEVVVLDETRVSLEWIRPETVAAFRKYCISRRHQHNGELEDALEVLLDSIRLLDSATTVERLECGPFRVVLHANVALLHMSMTQMESAAQWLQTMIQAQALPAWFVRTAQSLLHSVIAQYSLCMRRLSQSKTLFTNVQSKCRERGDASALFAELQQQMLSLSSSRSDDADNRNNQSVPLETKADNLMHIALQAADAMQSSMSAAAQIAAGMTHLVSKNNKASEDCLRNALFIAKGSLGNKHLQAVALALLGAVLARSNQNALSGQMITRARVVALETGAPVTICTVLALVLALLKEANPSSAIIATLQTELLQAKRDLIAQITAAKDSEAHKEVISFAKSTSLVSPLKPRPACASPLKRRPSSPSSSSRRADKRRRTTR